MKYLCFQQSCLCVFLVILLFQCVYVGRQVGRQKGTREKNMDHSLGNRFSNSILFCLRYVNLWKMSEKVGEGEMQCFGQARSNAQRRQAGGVVLFWGPNLSVVWTNQHGPCLSLRGNWLMCEVQEVCYFIACHKFCFLTSFTQ